MLIPGEVQHFPFCTPFVHEKGTPFVYALLTNGTPFTYRKIIPKISPGAYIFRRPFLRGLFLEGLKFGGAYVQREICVSKSIGLACSGKEIYHFCFVLLCI